MPRSRRSGGSTPGLPKTRARRSVKHRRTPAVRRSSSRREIALLEAKSLCRGPACRNVTRSAVTSDRV